MTKVCFAFLFALLLYGCTDKLATSGLKEGKIRSTTRYASFTDTTFSQLTLKFDYVSHKWYKDQLVIEEKVKWHSQTEHGKTVESLITTGYVLMDFKQKSAAEYATFSDTARPLQIFGLYDTVKLAGGSFHWGARKPDTTSLSRQVNLLTDTTIDNIVYKRAVRFYPKGTDKPRPYVQILYFRPDVSEDLERIYFWSDSLTRALKAPIVWVEDRLSLDNPMVLSKVSLDFLADTLTTQERKVFAAWEKNEKNR